MASTALRSSLSTCRAVIGMVHVQPSPGTPHYRGPPTKVSVQRAVQEAQLLERHGIDAVLVENMFDLPYSLPSVLDPVTVAHMSVVASEVRSAVSGHVPVGIQILAAANKEALAVAKVAGLDFVRVEGFVFGHLADEGWIEACAGQLLRYRRYLDAENVLILADVKKKHSAHAVTADVGLSETVSAAQFFGADGVIVTGTATGEPVSTHDLDQAASAKSSLPVLVGSGVTAAKLPHIWDRAHGFIVGSEFKRDGKWNNEIDEERLDTFMRTVRMLRRD